jgi:hypothetical protein
MNDIASAIDRLNAFIDAKTLLCFQKRNADLK